MSTGSARSQAGLLAAGAVLLLPVIVWPTDARVSWGLKVSVVLLMTGAGSVLLLWRAWAGDRVARIALLFVVAVTISTLGAGTVSMAAVGRMDWGNQGLVFFVAITAAWAIGASLSKPSRELVWTALVAAALLNAVAAWVRAFGAHGPLFAYTGGAAGLLGSPIHLGSMSAAGVWLTAERASRSAKPLGWLAATSVLAGSAELSSERAALGLTALALVLAVRRAGLRRMTLIVLAGATGIAIAYVVPHHEESATTRLTDRAGFAYDFPARADLWKASGRAVLDRPLFGYGPDRFTAAINHRSTPAMSRHGVAYWTDAHNVPIQLGVTLGLVGLSLLVVWLVLASRRARGPLAVFAALVTLAGLVEPLSLVLTPLALLALGAATSADPLPSPPLQRIWTGVAAGAVAIALVVGTAVTVGAASLRRAVDESSTGAARRAASLLRPWPESWTTLAAVENLRAVHGEAARGDEALHAAREVVDRDPTDPVAWVLLGSLEKRFGSIPAATIAFDRALEEGPWLRLTLDAQVQLALETHDAQRLDRACLRFQRIGVSEERC